MADEKQQDAGQQSGGEDRAAKRDTSRIELSDAETMDAADDGGEPLSVRQIVDGPEGTGRAAKSETARIDLDDAEMSPEETGMVMGKDATVRVDLTGVMARMQEAEAKKGQPAAEASGPKDERGATARIALDGVEPPPVAAEPPRTVRLKRPSAAPRTVVMARPSSEPPRTVVLKRPEAEEADDGEKGTTSRIQVPDATDLPPSGPPSGRKTIRIKRSGSGAPSSAKTLTIARPSKAASVTLPASADEALRELESNVSDEPGPLFGILAVAAVLVLCALVYVLAAQTVATNLPFPGRML